MFKVEYIKAMLTDNGRFEHKVLNTMEFFSLTQAMKRVKKFNKRARRTWTEDQYQYAALVPDVEGGEIGNGALDLS